MVCDKDGVTKMVVDKEEERAEEEEEQEAEREGEQEGPRDTESKTRTPHKDVENNLKHLCLHVRRIRQASASQYCDVED